ncbi:hypothetical protein F5884DRAFT_362506 [Xylogone sp. PMI_703]|nr:hypothetical protein F5884DRAFT_362506 [Xylogone sp. PMI_703]
MLSAIGRAAIRRLGAQPANRLVQSLQSTPRITIFKTCTVPLGYAHYTTSSVRLFAAATTTKTKKTSKKSPAKSTTSKAAPKKKAATAKKTTRKTTRKTAKKTTAKAKKPAKKQLTEKQKEEKQAKKEREHLRKLKETALLPGPHRLPDTAWMIVLSEYLKANAEKGNQTSGTKTKEAAAKYKSLSPEELEQYNHRANQNKAANTTAFKKWVASHTPDQIRLANNARKLLTKTTGKKYPSIADERAPKRPLNAYFLFAADRWASGDLKGISIPQSGSMIHEEWTKLPASEKKVFEDRAAADKERYAREAKTVFH